MALRAMAIMAEAMALSFSHWRIIASREPSESSSLAGLFLTREQLDSDVSFRNGFRDEPPTILPETEQGGRAVGKKMKSAEQALQDVLLFEKIQNVHRNLLSQMLDANSITLAAS